VVDRLAVGSAPQVRRPYSLLAVCGFLIFAVILVFGQTASHDFVNLDDAAYVYENWHVNRGLTGEGIAWAITARRASNWHPLTWLSHMLDCQFYALKPGGHHLTNVFLHAAAAVLLFLAFWRMTEALWPSAWVAAVFAIHPLRVESVAWVAERKDVLSGLFFTLTLWLYARYVERPSSWGRYLFMLVSFALGLTAKPMLVTLPFVLLLLDYWPLARLSPHRAGNQEDEASPPRPDRLIVRLVVEKIPLFVLAAASCVVTFAAQRNAMPSLEQMPFAVRAANAAVNYVAYLGKMLYPAGLAILYPVSKEPPPTLEVISAVSLLLAISVAAFVARRKCPYLLFGWLWYLGTLVPVIGLVQVGNQAMADRYTYLTQIGLCTALAWGAARLAGSWPYRRWPFATVAAFVVAGLMVSAWQQAWHWRNSLMLWSHTLAGISPNPLAHNALGDVLADHGQVDAAIAQYEKALEISPDFARAHNNLGSALASRGQVDAAIVQYEKALEIKPDLAQAHNNLGNALASRGQVDAAIARYEKALEISPDYAQAHNNLGYVLAGRGRVDAAIAHFQHALEINPDCVEAHYNVGAVLAGRGQIDAAIAHFQKALEINPDCVQAHYNIGAVLAGRGQVDAAIAHYQKAVSLVTAQNNKALADVIRARIRLLQSGTPAANAP
jgi:tetratricopeptide (TPR) repeat protein